MPKQNKYAAGALLSLSALCASVPMASAQDITLSSREGSFVIKGDLLDFDGSQFKIMSTIGEIVLDASMVICSGKACPQQNISMTDFAISGSTSLNSRVIPALLEDFVSTSGAQLTSSNRDGSLTTMSVVAGDGSAGNISLKLGGSTSGLGDLLESRANLAVTTRLARNPEERAFSRAGLGNLRDAENENIFALDALVFVTSARNPVRSISEADLAKVFAGEITNWSELGGPDAQINVYVRPENTGTGALFSQLIMRPQRLRVAANGRAVDSDAEMATAMASDLYGIGFTTFSNAGDARVLALKGTCGIQTPANVFTIKTEEYPYSQRLFMYRSEANTPDVVGRFIDYIRSPDSQEPILKSGYVDLGVSEVGVNDQGLRFAASVLPSDEEFELDAYRDMVNEFISAYRASITFRFEQGSSGLDSRGRADIRRLAELVTEGDFVGKEIMLIGFTDSVGPGNLNASLSVSRAEQVKEELLKALPDEVKQNLQVQTLGYGELSPLGCNDSLNGRQINRRVEVWTRDIIKSQ